MKGYCHRCGEWGDVKRIVFDDEEDIDFLGGGNRVIYVCIDRHSCQQRLEEARRRRREAEEERRREQEELDRLLSGLVRVGPFEFDPGSISFASYSEAEVKIGTVRGHPAVTVQYGPTSGVFYYASPEAGLPERRADNFFDEFFGD